MRKTVSACKSLKVRYPGYLSGPGAHPKVATMMGICTYKVAISSVSIWHSICAGLEFILSRYISLIDNKISSKENKCSDKNHYLAEMI